MVRVAGLLDQAAAGVSVRSPDGRTPRRRWPRSGSACSSCGAPGEALERELRPALAEAGIVVGERRGVHAAELAELETRFEREIFPC